MIFIEEHNAREYTLVKKAITNPVDFEDIYNSYFSRLHRYVEGKVKDRQDIEDIVSDVFLRILKRLPQFRNQYGLSLTAWIFTIAKNTIIDFYRRKKHQFDELQLDYLRNQEHDLTSNESFFSDVTDNYDLNTVLQELPRRRREIIVLKYFNGLRNFEIAQTLAIDERTVASNLRRGLQDLRTFFTKFNQLSNNSNKC